MTGTQILAVREALVREIADLPEFADVSCTVAYPLHYRNEEPREFLLTWRATFDHQPASMRNGRTHRDEQAQFQVVIKVQGFDLTPEETSARAVELGTAFEEWVADNRNPDFDGISLHSLKVQGAGELTELLSDHPESVLAYTVAYSARLA